MKKANDRQAVTVYLGLGSNLQNPERQLAEARQAIIGLAGVEELACSGLYRSPPMGPKDQPDYVNAVMAIVTVLPPLELLRCLQRIEAAQGRVRNGQRWGPRTLDLDLLIYGDERIAEADLTVPHPGMSERAFVLYPLYEIAPDLVVPGKGALSDLIERCPLNGLQRLA